MKIISLVVISLLLALPLIGESHPFPNFQHARINSYVEDLDPLDLLPSQSNHVNPYLPDLQSGNESPKSYAPEWGDDILVSNDWTMSNSVISFDYDADGYLYVMGISKNGDYDTLKLYKSTDQGMNWSQVWLYGVSNEFEFWDIEMRVNHTGSNPDIYFFFVDSSPNANQRELWFGVIDQPSMVPSWTFFDPDTYSNFEYPLELSMDITDDATPSIWCTYSRETTSNYGWATLYSDDGGATWNYLGHSSTRGGRDPYISIGEDYVYIICIYTQDSDSNAIRAYRCDLTGSGNHFWVSGEYLAERAYPCIASTRETFPNNDVIVLYLEGSGSSRRIRESVSSDGGQNFTIGQLWSITGDVFWTRPYLRSGWDGIAADEFCGVATRLGSFDSLVAAYNTGSGWTSRTVVNNHNSSGEVTPQATVITTGRAVIYRQWGSGNVWFDSYATGVEEISTGTFQSLNISSLNNQIRVNFTLFSPQQVKINIFDVAGRNVFSRNLGSMSEGSHSYNLSTDNLSSGRYFVNFSAEDRQLSKTVILF